MYFTFRKKFKKFIDHFSINKRWRTGKIVTHVKKLLYSHKMIIRKVYRDRKAELGLKGSKVPKVEMELKAHKVEPGLKVEMEPKDHKAEPGLKVK
jgi:hypothetical protein